MSNPDPERITDPMWRLWTDRPNQAWKLGGIYANKKGYHSTVIANKRYWPNNYSIKLPLDLVNKNNDKARAIDLTMSDSEMKKVTLRLKNSALDSKDNRLDAMKEFFGTLDGTHVYGLGKNSIGGYYRVVTADDSHLWHIHMSIFTEFVNDWKTLAPILSVLSGESFKSWSELTMHLPVKGDKGESVKYWQLLHNKVRNTVTPPSPAIIADGDYGDKTELGFKDFWLKQGGIKDFNATYLPGWLALRYQEALASLANPAALQNLEEIKKLVDAWLSAHVSKELNITGTLTGKVKM